MSHKHDHSYGHAPATTDDYATLVLGRDSALSTAADFGTLVQAVPWAQAVSRNPENPNVDLVANEVIFGRNKDCQVCFKDNKAISGKHCRIFREKGLTYLEDLSTNGTWVNGEKIGKGSKIVINSATEFVLIPRGKGMPKVSYMLYIHGDEKHKDEKAPEGTVCFVFTDVQGSTKLWEACPQGMDVGLRNHDRILRKLLTRFRGYEVKTEGDAFMVTFFSVLDAIRWCIAVQRALFECEWPEDILQQPSAQQEKDDKGKPIFNGIRIRMGMHVGEPNCRVNPITHRMDYFGPVVNRCARVSDSAHGGQIVCTQEILDIYLHAKKDKKLDEPKSDKHSSDSKSPSSTSYHLSASPASSVPSSPVHASTSSTTSSSASSHSHASTSATQTQILQDSFAKLHIPKLDSVEVDLNDIVIKELGNHSLKGINHPIKIYQLMPEEFSTRTFPALRAGRVREDLLEEKKRQEEEDAKKHAHKP
jgi:class 3 adenylate cyclase